MQPLDPTPWPLDHLTARGHPDAPALILKGETLTYAALERQVGRLAAALIGTGLTAGDRVASWLPKGLVSSILPLACARAGLVHVPINPLLKRGQVAHILADSGAGLLLSGAVRLATLQTGDLPEGCRAADETAQAAMLDHGDALGASSADPSHLVALLYTSGSTGRPKGVMLTHANLWLGAISVAAYLRLAADDVTLAVLPYAFDYGQNQLLSTWAAGGAVVPLDYLTPRDVVRAVERLGITTLAGVPPLWVQLIEADWSAGAGGSLRRLTNSGGRMPASVSRRLRAMFPAADLYLMYGLTEAFRSTYLDPARVDRDPDSIGTAIPLAEVLVARADGSEAAAGEPGELVHCGPLVAAGYWRDRARTAERFRPAPAASRHGGLAVWSGDTVRRDDEGLLYFVGRDDAMIKTSGNRVSPTEIEDAAIASGAALEAAAFGWPDDRLGEAIVLVARGSARDEDRLRDHFRRELPAFMQPARIIWRETLPTGPNGKLDREAIKGELV